jgi:hypothetical protein
MGSLGGMRVVVSFLSRVCQEARRIALYRAIDNSNYSEDMSPAWCGCLEDAIMF